MAKRNLEALANSILESLTASGPAKAGADPQSRKELLRVPGQVLIVIKERFSTILTTTLPELEGKTKVIDELWLGYLKELLKLENKILSNTKTSLAKAKTNSGELKLSLVLAQRDKFRKGTVSKNTPRYAFALSTFDQTKEANKILKSLVATKLGKKEGDREVEKLSGRGASSTKQYGQQWGHADAETGGVSSVALRVLKAEKVFKSLGVSNDTIQNKFTEIKQSLECKPEHLQDLDNNGNLKKEYVVLITQQFAWENQKQSKDLESKAIDELKEVLVQEIDMAEGENSPSLKKALERTVLYNLAGREFTNKKVLGEKSKKVRSNTKTQKKKANKVKDKTTIKSSAGISANDIKTAGKKKRSSGNDLFALASIINTKLPDTVRKNMRLPGLENVTGRFANSVKVTDASLTAKGYPSIGYTYQRDPYQVFEVGMGRPGWATSQRDPRKLIDASIREIAAEMAIGRFYTRRQ